MTYFWLNLAQITMIRNWCVCQDFVRRQKEGREIQILRSTSASCLKWNKNWEYVPRYKRIRYNFNSTKKRFLPHCEIACVLGNCLGTKFSNMTWKLSKPINPGRNLSTLWISTAYLPAIQYLNCTVCNIFAEIARQNLLNYITFCLKFMALQAWF